MIHNQPVRHASKASRNNNTYEQRWKQTTITCTQCIPIQIYETENHLRSDHHQIVEQNTNREEIPLLQQHINQLPKEKKLVLRMFLK